MVNTGLSLREHAKKYRFSHSFVAKVQKKYSTHSFKSQKVTNCSKTQEKSARTCCRMLHYNFIYKNFCNNEDNQICIKYDHQQIFRAVYYIPKYKGEHRSIIINHDNRPVFWPDLASSHYGKLVMEL